MNLILLTWMLLCISIPGFLFCLFRSLRALKTKNIRALSQVYSANDDPLEYRVWLWTHILLSLIFLAIVVIILQEQNSLDDAPGKTSFHTRLILLLQFSALIALVPFLIRLFFSKSKSKPPKAANALIDQARRCASLTEALTLLEKDYRIESRDTSGELTTLTLCSLHNSSELIWIEVRDEQILKID